jgi:hypothetical protein
MVLPVVLLMFIGIHCCPHSTPDNLYQEDDACSKNMTVLPEESGRAPCINSTEMHQTPPVIQIQACTSPHDCEEGFLCKNHQCLQSTSSASSPIGIIATGGECQYLCLL